jgi:hypothetical protein
VSLARDLRVLGLLRRRDAAASRLAHGGHDVISKAARLRLIRDGIRGLRHDLSKTLGLDRVSEVVLLDTIVEAIEGLIAEAQRPRSRPGVPAVYVAPETREAAGPEARS